MKRSMINDLPYEILSDILEHVTDLNKQDAVTYTFGLSQAPIPLQTCKLQKYVRGPVPPDMLKWDATASIRQVCRTWHDWALDYALKDVYIRRWRGSERWAELSRYRDKYRLYELIDRPSGAAVYRDPHVSLFQTAKLLSSYSTTASKVQRLWFNGFYLAETDQAIFDVLRFCSNLVSVSLPWTTLRHGRAQDWATLLNSGDGRALESLELLAVDITETQAKDPRNAVDFKPLKDSRVNFSKLKRLKIFGNTKFMPVTDADLQDIARTATGLHDLHITGLSTTTIKGLLSLIKSSHSTLRVIEHSPRSEEGFDHPHPGTLPANEPHICEILTSCPHLHDLSISIPSMCPALFSNENVAWKGETQIRAARLCTNPTSTASQLKDLKAVLAQSRALISTSARYAKQLTIELFFANCIFDPHLELVHGDFDVAAARSDFQWPRSDRRVSWKGPYGATGLYGKLEDGHGGEEWVVLGEEEWAEGVQRGWVRLDEE